MNSLFVSAFLSELIQEKRIKMSNLKVGGSKLYLLPNQQESLEKFYKFLHPKEAETFLLLKEKKILKDSEQEPAIRVALRSIKDFAIHFKENEEIYWRYLTFSEDEALKKITKPLEIKSKQKSETKTTKPKETKTKQTSFQNPLIIKQKKPKKQKPKSEFVEKIIRFLSTNHKIIQEDNYKPKEYNCRVQIKSELGPINFLTQAKDKKTISETDIKKLLSNAQSIPLPALILYTGTLSKKAQQLAKDYQSILKTRKIQ
jgi:hypothetical protein